MRTLHSKPNGRTVALVLALPLLQACFLFGAKPDENPTDLPDDGWEADASYDESSSGSSTVEVIENPAPETLGPLVIDLHAHLDQPGMTVDASRPATVDRLLASMDRANIHQAGIITMARKGNVERTRAENDRILNIARQFQGRLFPIGSVHPDDGRAARDELARLEQLGFKMVKLHPVTQGFDVGSAEMSALARKAGELGLVLLIDGWSPFDADLLGKILRLAASYPKARFVVAHMGGARYMDLLAFRVAAMYPWYKRNVWFDLSATSHLLVGSPMAEELVWMARKLGTDRILFGSDFPMVDPEVALDGVRRLGFTDQELRQILHENAAQLLGYEVPGY